MASPRKYMVDFSGEYAPVIVDSLIEANNIAKDALLKATANEKDPPGEGGNTGPQITEVSIYKLQPVNGFIRTKDGRIFKTIGRDE